MNDLLTEKIEIAAATSQNLGELKDADVVGTVGSSNCGDMLRLWVKFRDEENGRRVIDRATFQSFGCQTAIAVAAVATELIRGKTADEALAMSGEDLSAPLGALPPMKIHCAQLVEDALRSALKPDEKLSPASATETTPQGSTLLDQLKPSSSGKLKINLQPTRKTV